MISMRMGIIGIIWSCAYSRPPQSSTGIFMDGRRAETNTPVCYGLVPWSESLSDLLLGYGYDPEVFSGAGGYGY